MTHDNRDMRQIFRDLVALGGLTYQQTADKLHVSYHTVTSWMKPSRPTPPPWAVELLAYKVGLPLPSDWLDRPQDREDAA